MNVDKFPLLKQILTSDDPEVQLLMKVKLVPETPKNIAEKKEAIDISRIKNIYPNRSITDILNDPDIRIFNNIKQTISYVYDEDSINDMYKTLIKLADELDQNDNLYPITLMELTDKRYHILPSGKVIVDLDDTVG